MPFSIFHNFCRRYLPSFEGCSTWIGRVSWHESQKRWRDFIVEYLIYMVQYFPFYAVLSPYIIVVSPFTISESKIFFTTAKDLIDGRKILIFGSTKCRFGMFGKKIEWRLFCIISSPLFLKNTKHGISDNYRDMLSCQH